MYFRCPKCRKTFKSLKSKQCHMGRMHKYGVCDACGGEFDDLCTHKLWHCTKIKTGRTPGDDKFAEKLPKKYECKKEVKPKWLNKIKVEDSSGNILGEWTTGNLSISVIGDNINIEFGRSK